IEACIKSFGKRPTEYKVALDGLSVYVNESNPVNELDLEQLARIFTAKISNWKTVGGPDEPITLYSREISSGTSEFFKQHILEGADCAASTQTLKGTAQIIQAVANERKGIGYGGAAYGKGVKHLKIKTAPNSPGIVACEDTILRGSYPIW